jgi:hypothetical protein
MAPVEVGVEAHRVERWVMNDQTGDAQPLSHCKTVESGADDYLGATLSKETKGYLGRPNRKSLRSRGKVVLDDLPPSNVCYVVGFQIAPVGDWAKARPGKGYEVPGLETMRARVDKMEKSRINFISL